MSGMKELFFETGWGSLCKYGEELCGDKVEIIKCGGDTIMVLADGMGSGVKANILASLTSKIVSTMLEADAAVEDIVETMAATLPICRERGVAYATFTFLRLSPSGQARLVEFDNPGLVLLRRGRRQELDTVERVIGGKRIRESHVIMEPDDLLVFFSDGVIHAGIGMTLNLGWQRDNVIDYLERRYSAHSSAQAVEEDLLEACSMLYADKPGDDTTVAVCRVLKPNVAYVMVGPPMDPAEDERIVCEMMDSPGVKIVCGGTTSQIVSRVTGRELETQLEYVSLDVPPVGRISGVDLVTEGVVTLSKTLELMNRYEKGGPGRENALKSKRDAAHLLASYLILKSTGARFIVGRALNPAHQKPEMPISLNIKLKLVEDIAACLRRLGRDAAVEYH